MAAPVLPRGIRSVLEAALKDTPVVALLGPRQSGKTTLAQALTPAREYVTLDDDVTRRAALEDPATFVAALPPRVTIDEVQRAPGLMLAIKAAVDRERRPGRFLLTGSADLLLLPKVGDSLAGRIEFVHLHPLAESEKERTGGQVLRGLLEGGLAPRILSSAPPPVKEIGERVVRGGYPATLARSPSRARQWHRQYLRSVLERDVEDVARVRGTAELNKLLELLALRTGNLLNVSGLSADVGIRRETVEQYLLVLERLFLARRLPAWHRNASKRLVKTPKVHLVDSGLSATLAGIDAADWMQDKESFGHLLESFVVQQLMAQAGWTDPDLRFWHYRDKDQVEVDLVVTRGRKTWGVEVKAAASVAPSDGQGLRRLAEQCGKEFQGGMVLYAGTNTVPIGGERILAVPLTELWER